MTNTNSPICGCGVNCLDTGDGNCRYMSSSALQDGDERERFEAHFRGLSHDMDFVRDSEGYYEDLDTQRFWTGWEASLASNKAAAVAAREPVPMLLFCPQCGTQHIDAPEDHKVDKGSHVDMAVDWSNPPHRSHLCHACELIWRPADVATTGVASIQTKGKADTWAPDMPWTGLNRPAAPIASAAEAVPDAWLHILAKPGKRTVWASVEENDTPEDLRDWLKKPNSYRVDKPLYTHPAPIASAEAAAVWVDCPGFEEYYEISDMGDVRSKNSGRILAKNLAGAGYVKADLWKDGERLQTYVHILVARAFVKTGEGTQVNHINGTKTDNRAVNLEWVTKSENEQHSRYVLGNLCIPIVAEHIESGVTVCYPSISDAARKLDLDGELVRQCVKGKRKTHKGYRFSAHPAAAQPSRAEVLETWQPIETAPKTGRTLLLGYPNVLGKWRTVRGQWMSEAYIAENWEEPDDAETGWYETSAEADDVPNCWPITPTHWMPLPIAPKAKP
jgi:hypothetical protein